MIIKYADDTPILGLIGVGDEVSYRELVQCITVYAEDNDLALNLGNTKELILDFK